jgi:hypothetical protein
MQTDTWRDKANELIATYCAHSYREANFLPTGRKRKRHIAYSVPEIAAALVAALRANDEHEAKRLFEIERLGAWSMI